jgi:hypothetical protein
VANAIGRAGTHVARYTADFARLDSVRTLADALTSDFPRIDVLLNKLDRPTGLGPHRRYARAKLAALLLHREHQRRHPDLGIVNVHPGIVASDFGRYMGRTGTVLKHLSRPFLLSPRSAATALVSLATHRTHEPQYFNRLRPAIPSPLVDNQHLAQCVYDDAIRRLPR